MPESIDSRDPNIDLHTHIHSSIIHNSQKVETTQVSINRWTEKQNVVHPNTGILFGLKKGGNSDTHYSVDETWGHDAEWNKPDTEGQILSDSTHKRSLEESNPQRQEVDGGGQGLGEGMENQCLTGTENPQPI